MSKEPPSTGTTSMQQPQMQQGGRGGPMPQSNMNRYENPRSQRGRPAETEDTDDYS